MSSISVAPDSHILNRGIGLFYIEHTGATAGKGEGDGIIHNQVYSD